MKSGVKPTKMITKKNGATSGKPTQDLDLKRAKTGANATIMTTTSKNIGLRNGTIGTKKMEAFMKEDTSIIETCNGLQKDRIWY